MNIWFLALCPNRGTNRWCQWHAQLGFEHWVDHLDPKWLGFVIYLVLRMHHFRKYHLLRGTVNHLGAI